MRTSEVEIIMRAQTAALRNIANLNDCDYVLDKERPDPCSCATCEARAALEIVNNWRFQGAGVDRQRTCPREKLIMDAFKELFDKLPAGQGADNMLASLLGDGGVNPDHYNELPSPRDWFVASTMIQWVVTNVGQTILFAAGYELKAERERGEELRRQHEARLVKADSKDIPVIKNTEPPSTPPSIGDGMRTIISIAKTALTFPVKIGERLTIEGVGDGTVISDEPHYHRVQMDDKPTRTISHHEHMESVRHVLEDDRLKHAQYIEAKGPMVTAEKAERALRKARDARAQIKLFEASDSKTKASFLVNTLTNLDVVEGQLELLLGEKPSFGEGSG